MTKKIGSLLLILTVCGFLGYQALQAGSDGQRGRLDNGPSSNMKTPQPTLQKLTEEETQALLESERIKAEIERQELMMPSGGSEEVVEVDGAALEDANKLEFERAALDALAQMEAGLPLTPAQKELILQYLEQNPGYADQNSGRNPLDNQGGPDGANYYFVDNVTPDTADYDWIELRGDPLTVWINDISNHDDGYSASKYPFGFNFPFYGATYDSFRVAVNGFIEFTTSVGSLSNVCLPSTSISGPAVFVFWNDLHLNNGGIPSGTDVIGYRNFGDYVVVEYDSIGNFSSSCVGSLKFQAIFFSDGRIKLQYNQLIIGAGTACDSTMTIGIQSNGVAGSPALNYVCNTTGYQATDTLAIWFYQVFFPNDFGTSAILSPTGVYAPSAVVNVTARFRNNGTTTQSSPVSYTFNGGPVVTEATGVLSQNQTEDLTFATQITLPGVTGSYPLTVWTDLASDEARGNDTMRINVQVFTGGDCPSAIVLAGNGPDSALYNNCGAGDNSPGQPCGASGQDMVFQIEVPDGNQLVVWQRSDNTITGRHTLRWGGACPGSNFVDCSTTESRRMRFVNNTGSTQTAWVTVGNSTAPGTCGNLGIGWQLTACSPVSPPAAEGFEGPALPLLPDCWGTVQALPLTATTSPLWENYGTNPRTGTRVASVLGASVGNDDWLFSNGVTLTGGNTYVVEFWWRGASTTVPESLEVKAGTENTVAGMTLTVMPMDTIKRTVYTQRIFNVVAPVTGTYYVGWHNVTKRSAGRSYIDDAQIYPSGACSAPTVTVNSVTGQDSAGLVANVTGGSGGPPEYQWFTGTGCDMANIIVGARTATYYAPTSGIYSCRAWIIDSLNCASCDSAIATVIDCSISTALPYSEGFEGTSGTAFPTCWSVVTYDADAIRWVTSATSPHSGTRCAYIQYSASGVFPNDWLFTPLFGLTAGTDYLLDFWWRQYLTSSTYFDSLAVFLTSAPNNGSVVSTVVPIFRANTTTYQETFGLFSPPANGDYYLAFVYTGSANAGGIRVDDVALAVAGTCTAPTASVADSSRVGSVIMFCSAAGGSGGPLVYQWYTGQACLQANAIAGATNSTYTTFASGDYACRAYRADSVNCAACDWGTATVLPPPPGETCNNPIVATPPSPGTPTVITGTTTGAIADCADSCNSTIARSSGPDHFISLTLASCARITMALDDGTNNGDMYITVYESGNCCTNSILCNDDKSAFDTLYWETPGQRNPGGVTSFVGGELPAGTYLIRVARYTTSSGAYRLTIYDNGPCPCDVSCVGGDQAEAVEDRYNNAFNDNDPDGGCNNITPTYGTIVPGQTICGVGFNYLNPGGTILRDYYRDTDWYTFSLAQPASMILTVNAEFMAQYGIISGPAACPNPPFAIQDTALECELTTINVDLAAGDYAMFVAPLNYVGNPMPSTYRASLTFACVPDTVANLTAYLVNVDGDPTANDIRLKWTALDGFGGTYKVYMNTVMDAFPGTWQEIATGITPVYGLNAMTYVHDDALIGGQRRFYLVISECAAAVAASMPTVPDLAK